MCNGTSSGSDPCQDSAPVIRLEGRPFIACITVSFGYAGDERHGWWAKTFWTTTAINHPSNTEGTIETRYANDSLSDAIDYVLATVQKFGILVGVPATDRILWLEYSEPDIQTAPANWRDTLKAEADRRGWHVDPREDLINA